MGIRIKSQTDIITNSSSETFIVRKPSGYTLESFRKLIKEVTEERVISRFDLPYDTYDAMSDEAKKTWNSMSGMGGDLSIQDEKYYQTLYEYPGITDPVESARKTLDFDHDLKLPEGVDEYFVVDLDRDYKATVFYILSHFDIISIDSWWPVAGKEDKRIRDLWGYDRHIEWEALEDHPYLPRTKIYQSRPISNILVSKPGSRKILVYTTEDEDKVKEVLRLLPELLPDYNFEVIHGDLYEKHVIDFLLPDIIDNKLKI